KKKRKTKMNSMAWGLRRRVGVLECSLQLQKLEYCFSEELIREVQTPRRHLQKLCKSVGKVKGVGKRPPRPHPMKGVKSESRSILSVCKPGEFYNYFGITATDFYEKIMTEELARLISEPRHDGVIQKVERNTLSPDSRILLL